MKTFRYSLVTLIVVFLIAGLASAQSKKTVKAPNAPAKLQLVTTSVSPAVFAVQGVLRDPAGRSVDDATYILTFAIYDDASGGTKLWTETIPNVPVSHGIFGSKLGAINSLASLSFTQQYWLGITVQGGTEMVPRIELVKSPSALSVAGANNVVPSTGNAGIGTTSPNSKVEVVGAGNTNDTRGLTVRNADGTAALSVLDNGAVGVHEESPDAGLRVTGMGVDSFSRAFHVTDANGTSQLMVRNDGNVGIGTSSPQSKLEVNGDVRLSQGGTGKLIFPDNSVLTTANLGGAASSVTNPTDAVMGADNDADGSGGLLFNTGASTRMYIQNDGAIGVGTTTPGFTMDIQGSLGVRDGATIGGLLSAYSGVAIGGRDGYMVDNAFGNLQNDRYGIAEHGGTTRLYTSGYYGPSALALSLASGIDTFTDLLYIDHSGRVGINKTNPNNTLHVYAPSSGMGLTVDGATNPGISLNSSGNGMGAIGIATAAGAWASDAAINDIIVRVNTGSHLLLNSNTGGASSMSIWNGRVGIGVLSPAYKLDVSGSLRSTGGDIDLVGTVDNTSGNIGIGGTRYSNAKFTITSNETFALDVHGNGYITGNLAVNGSISKGSGSFKIDHPLDPENKWLYHSFVESPDMMNIYNGNIQTDANGTAVVTMPSYFDALNSDFRYQLTVIGQFAQAIISKEMKGNTFELKTDKPGVKVSWQVTGVRRDAFANAHRIVPEVSKQGDEVGKYMYAKELNKPASMQMVLEKDPVLSEKQKDN